MENFKWDRESHYGQGQKRRNLLRISAPFLCAKQRTSLLFWVLQGKVWHLKEEEKFHMVKLCDICQLNFLRARNADLFFLKVLINSFPFHWNPLFHWKKIREKKKVLLWHFPIEIIQFFNQDFQSRFSIWISLSLHSFWEEEVKCIYFRIIATEKRCFK